MRLPVEREEKWSHVIFDGIALFGLFVFIVLAAMYVSNGI